MREWHLDDDEGEKNKLSRKNGCVSIIGWQRDLSGSSTRGMGG